MAGQAKVRIVRSKKAVLEQLSQTKSHQGVVLHATPCSPSPRPLASPDPRDISIGVAAAVP